MSGFGFYFRQGVEHITDLNGLDHMVFIITLCAVFNVSEWRKILVLVTAFTIGHTVTLALSSLEAVRVNQNLVETLIPVTILFTSVFNVVRKNGPNGNVGVNYLLAMGFGLIHGMGFSGFFKAMMMGISDGSVVFPLFSFNLGIELGQMLIVGVFMIVMFLFTRLLSVDHKNWSLYISGAGGGVAVTMIVKTLLAM